MLSRIKMYIRKIIRRAVFGSSLTSDTFIKSLKKSGVSIGEGTQFFDPINNIVDLQNPKLLTIGKNVGITSGVIILTHDFSWSVVSGVYGDCIGGVRPVIIGDNVFIGMRSIVLMGTTIGNNVIIGAGSVVSGNLESNSVYAGNPAIKIMSLEEFYTKRKGQNEDQIEKILANINVADKNEIWKYLREYSCQFEDAPESLSEQIMNDSGYKEICWQYYKTNERLYRLKDFMNME